MECVERVGFTLGVIGATGCKPIERFMLPKFFCGLRRWVVQIIVRKVLPKG